jgi:acetyl esterase
MPRLQDEVAPYASPAHAASLADLPPTLIATAELDPLREAGVAVDEVRYAGQIHGFLALNGDFRDSVDLTRRVGEAIQTNLQDMEAAAR